MTATDRARPARATPHFRQMPSPTSLFLILGPFRGQKGSATPRCTSFTSSMPATDPWYPRTPLGPARGFFLAEFFVACVGGLFHLLKRGETTPLLSAERTSLRAYPIPAISARSLFSSAAEAMERISEERFWRRRRELQPSEHSFRIKVLYGSKSSPRSPLC